MKASEIDKIAKRLSYDLSEEFNNRLKKRLNGVDPDIEFLVSDQEQLELSTRDMDIDLDLRIMNIASELKRYNETYVVELIKSILADDK